MAWEQEEKTIVIAILLVILAFTMYIELKYFRGRNREVRRVGQRRDEAYNAVLTTRAAVNTMRRQGRDTEPAHSMLTKAKKALENGEYSRCLDLCESARDELTRSKPAQSLTEEEDKEPIDLLADRILSSRPASQMTRPEAYRGTVLPLDKEPNFLQARFEIGAARGEIERAARSGADVVQVENALLEAEREFSARNYSKALSLAVRARKMLSGEVLKEAIPLKKEPTLVEELSEMVAPAREAPPASEGGTCGSCGEFLESGDEFCGACGAQTVRERFCGNCGTPAKPKNKFCRKCGSNLD